MGDKLITSSRLSIIGDKAIVIGSTVIVVHLFVIAPTSAFTKALINYKCNNIKINRRRSVQRIGRIF